MSKIAIIAYLKDLTRDAMKTQLKFGLGVLALSLGLAGCKDDDTIFNVKVYTSLDTTQVYQLYVDGDPFGSVPSLGGTLTCDSTERLQSCLDFSLPSGKYKWELWDEAGATVSSFRLKAYENSLSVSGNNGGSNINGTGTCLVIRID
jgi:hypothetical protein